MKLSHCTHTVPDSPQQAGIYPTSEQIEHFSQLLPGTSFLDILTLFFKMAQIADGTFFLCNTEVQLDVARSLQDLRLPLKDLYKMSLAPVEKEYSLDILKEVGEGMRE